MVINNKTEKTLSGPAIFIGLTFLLLGVLFLINKVWIAGIPILLFALFLFLSDSWVEIDTEKRRIRKYNKYFGIFKSGKWRPLDNYLGVTLIPMNTVYKMLSRSNRSTSISSRDFQIFLVNKAKRPAFVIKKCQTLEQAQASLDEFSIWLKMPVFSVK